MTSSSQHPLFGLWKPHQLKHLYYGTECVSNHLLSTLPTDSSKAFIITGSSIASKTPLIPDLEKQLGTNHHAGTFSNIRQHAPVADLDQAVEAIQRDSAIDTLISVGGGSPIDAAKAISYRLHEKSGKYLTHITIPTTLSAAECTALAGTTTDEGIKTLVSDPQLAPNAIFYDPAFAAHTPKRLWLATGVRALDHAVESMYHPSTTEMPCRVMAMHAVKSLFADLPEAKEKHPNDPELSTRLFLAAFASLGFVGQNLTQGLGLSHSLGYALGSPYGIPHGETSCLTLGPVVHLKASLSADDAQQIARLLPAIQDDVKPNGDYKRDADKVAERIEKLVDQLGLWQSLTDRGVKKDQIPVIAKRANGGQTDGEMYPRLVDIVKDLYGPPA